MKVMLLASVFVTTLAGASAAAAKQAIACDSTIIAKSIPADYPLLIFGEIHGTENAPAYVGDVVCARLKALPEAELTVALEYPMQESAHLLAYIESRGNPSDQQRLLASPFWQREMQDGRSSRAMLALIERLRKWHAKVPALRVVAFDPVDDSSLGPTRDEAMAVIIKRIVQETDNGLTIVLTGNLHARRTPGLSGRPDYKTLASVLDLPFKTYNLTGSGGAYWACTPLCGEQTFGPSRETDSKHDDDLSRVRANADYDGSLSLGAFRLSRPAVEPKPGRM